VAGVTLVLAVVWLFVLFVLNRQYGRAFEQTLSSRWIEPDATPEAVRTPRRERRCCRRCARRMRAASCSRSS